MSGEWNGWNAKIQDSKTDQVAKWTPPRSPGAACCCCYSDPQSRYCFIAASPRCDCLAPVEPKPKFQASRLKRGRLEAHVWLRLEARKLKGSKAQPRRGTKNQESRINSQESTCHAAIPHPAIPRSRDTTIIPRFQDSKPSRFQDSVCSLSRFCAWRQH
jgi:hypothetical protein